jgi:hypothetical protein
MDAKTWMDRAVLDERCTKALKTAICRSRPVCPCESCDGRPLPTGRMIRRDGRWFCSEESYLDFVFGRWQAR